VAGVMYSVLLLLLLLVVLLLEWLWLLRLVVLWQILGGG